MRFTKELKFVVVFFIGTIMGIFIAQFFCATDYAVCKKKFKQTLPLVAVVSSPHIDWDYFLKRNVELRRQSSLYIYITPYTFDFQRVKKAEAVWKGVDRRQALRILFDSAKVAAGSSSHEAIWGGLSNLISRSVQHSPIMQPMDETGNMVTDPLVLLELGEGRCGHVARLVVDFALANGYDARLVQLAAHQVAEVFWEGNWHCIDANADFPPSAFKSFPSVKELSQNPYVLDQYPSRGYLWNSHTHYFRNDRGEFTSGYIASRDYTNAVWSTWVSSSYFAKELFGKRKGVEYWVKSADPATWQQSRYYGWYSSKLAETEPVAMVPIEHPPLIPTLLIPEYIYKKKDERAIVPIRFYPAVDPDNVLDGKKGDDGIVYEIRISSKSRRWDYDFRNFDLLGTLNSGDILVTADVNAYPNGLLGVDVDITNYERVYVEILAKDKNGLSRSAWFAPSRERIVDVVSLDQLMLGWRKS